MAESNGHKPRILGLDGHVIRPPNDKDGDICTVGDLREVVDYFSAQIGRAQAALQIQQRALITLENRTLRGRWRRLKVKIALWSELAHSYVNGWLMELGVVKPVAEVPRPDLDNPEAMPKV